MLRLLRAYRYCIVSAYVYTSASIYEPLLTGKASTTLGSFTAIQHVQVLVYLAVVCAFEPVPFCQIM